MRITPLIDHLRNKIPALQNRIAGCVNFQQILEMEPRLALPAVYVMLGAEVGEPVYPQKQTYIQLTSQNIYLFVEIDNTRDPRGQASQDLVDDFRIAFNRALVNYQYIPFQFPIEFVESDIAYMDRARYIHKFQYKLVRKLDFTDGVQTPYTDFKILSTDINLTTAQESDWPNAQVINNFEEL